MKSCRWLDSNRRPLESEETALPTEPQPLRFWFSFNQKSSTSCGIKLYTRFWRLIPLERIMLEKNYSHVWKAATFSFHNKRVVSLHLEPFLCDIDSIWVHWEISYAALQYFLLSTWISIIIITNYYTCSFIFWLPPPDFCSMMKHDCDVICCHPTVRIRPLIPVKIWRNKLILRHVVDVTKLFL